jgi:hypothetical protein
MSKFDKSKVEFRSGVPSFAFQATAGRQGSKVQGLLLPLAAGAVSLIEEETSALRNLIHKLRGGTVKIT